MATATEVTTPIVPEYLEKPTEQMANTLGTMMGQPLNVPAQEVYGFTPTQLLFAHFLIHQESQELSTIHQMKP